MAKWYTRCGAFCPHATQPPCHSQLVAASVEADLKADAACVKIGSAGEARAIDDEAASAKHDEEEQQQQHEKGDTAVEADQLQQHVKTAH